MRPECKRAAKVLRSLAKHGEITEVVDLIHKDINSLVLHQTTQWVGIGDRSLKELA
jgi:hypothetical protein